MILLALVLSLPSIAFTPYSFGIVPLILIEIACFKEISKRLSERTLKLVSLLAIASFLVIVPVYNIYINPQLDFDFDRDDALEIASTRLFHGEYPYSVPTQTGMPITPMAGALILAYPFVLLGNVALQNVIWLYALAFYLSKHGWRVAFFALACLLSSPMIFQEFLYEGDLLTNTIYVALAIVWFRRNYSIPSSLFLGLTLASRLNFLIWLPILFFDLYYRYGLLKAVQKMTLVSAVFIALTLPFYMYSPSEFSPLHTLGKLGVDGFLGFGVFVTLTIALFVFMMRKHDAMLTGSLAQIIPVFMIFIAYSAQNIHPAIINDRLSYGMYATVPFILFYLETHYEKVSKHYPARVLLRMSSVSRNLLRHFPFKQTNKEREFRLP